MCCSTDMCGRLDLKPDLPAQAQGANACSIGRPYLYGLAAGGQTGVERALELLRAEIERAMALLGVSSVDQIGLEHVRRVGKLDQGTRSPMTNRI